MDDKSDGDISTYKQIIISILKNSIGNYQSKERDNVCLVRYFTSTIVFGLIGK